jgi:hypothetical protein
VRESRPKHTNERQRELPAKADDFSVIWFNELAAQFRMLAGGKRAYGTNTSARRSASIDYSDGRAGYGEFVRGRQAGEARSGDDDASTTHGVHRSNCGATHL